MKLRTSNFVCIFTGLIGLSEQKSIKNVGKSSCGRRQGLSKIFRAAIYRAHRAVVFVIARLSCKFIKTLCKGDIEVRDIKLHSSARAQKSL